MFNFMLISPFCKRKSSTKHIGLVFKDSALRQMDFALPYKSMGKQNPIEASQSQVIRRSSAVNVHPSMNS